MKDLSVDGVSFGEINAIVCEKVWKKLGKDWSVFVGADDLHIILERICIIPQSENGTW